MQFEHTMLDKIFIEPSQIQNLLINGGNCKTLQNKDLRH